jgi:hypothetical protein
VCLLQVLADHEFPLHARAEQVLALQLEPHQQSPDQVLAFHSPPDQVDPSQLLAAQVAAIRMWRVMSCRRGSFPSRIVSPSTSRPLQRVPHLEGRQ